MFAGCLLASAGKQVKINLDFRGWISLRLHIYRVYTLALFDGYTPTSSIMDGPFDPSAPTSTMDGPFDPSTATPSPPIITVESVEAIETQLLTSLTTEIALRKVTLQKAKEEFEKSRRALEEATSDLKSAEEFLKAAKTAVDTAKAASSGSRQRSRELFIRQSEELCKEATSEAEAAQDYHVASARTAEMHKITEESLSEILAAYEEYHKRISIFSAHKGLPISYSYDVPDTELQRKIVETGSDPNDDTLLRAPRGSAYRYYGSVRVGSEILFCHINSDGWAYLSRNGKGEIYNGKVEVLCGAPHNQVEWIDAENGIVPSERMAVKGGSENGDVWYYAKCSDRYLGKTNPNIVSVLLIVLIRRLMLLREGLLGSSSLVGLTS